MGVDQNSRLRLGIIQVSRAIIASTDRLAVALTTSPLIKALDKFEVSGQSLKQLRDLVEDLNTKIKILAATETKIPKEIKMNFPKEFPVKGKVKADIVTAPPLQISNLSEITKKLELLITGLQLALYKTVGAIKVPEKVEVKNWAELIEGIEELKKGFNLLINQEKKERGEKPMEVVITNFPPQMVPQPVTKIDINPLRGELTSTGVTVGTTVTPLPGTALARRRSIIVFNNDTSKNLYIGGANVTTSGARIGLPVLAQTYSPTIDAASNMVLYGIVASGTVQAVTLEGSNDYGTTSTTVGNV